VLIADSARMVADSIAHRVVEPLIVRAVLFSVQIYCDFSGYTDIAGGESRWSNFH
jgi:D-alanyl-lipoteichoic acid acyltransferase DltB (MBOAT superfamily)